MCWECMEEARVLNLKAIEKKDERIRHLEACLHHVAKMFEIWSSEFPLTAFPPQGTSFPPQGTSVDEMREKLAALCHDQWSGWMEYLFSKCHKAPSSIGSMAVIPGWAVLRWRRQMVTPYAKLSEEEKNSDRKEADRFLALLMHGEEQRRDELVCSGQPVASDEESE